MIRVKVPATTANIGSGFDSLGIGLNIYNTFVIEEIENGLEILGVDEEYANEENLVYKSMVRAFEKAKYKPKGIKISMDVEIPISRGLGSSASCIVGGVVGANILMGNPLSNEEILELIVEIEGHPDNVVPAFLGGMLVSHLIDGKIIYNPIEIKKGLKFICLIPDFTLSTEKSRGVLPKEVPFADGVFNVSRVSILISALVNGNFPLIKYGLKDKLHQPYRGDLIPDFDNIMEKIESLGVGAYLSGAGPSIMIIGREEDEKIIEELEVYLGTLANNWVVKELEVDLEGVKVL